MAAVLKLVHGATTLNFQDTSGWYLEEGGWIPKIPDVADDEPPNPVEEVITLYLKGTNHDDVATNIQAVDDMRVLARKYQRDPTLSDPVYLHAKLDNETGERRAVVKRISSRWLSPHYSGEMIDSQPRIRLAIEREMWETTIATTGPGPIEPRSAAVITYDYTSVVGVGGDAAGRINHFQIISASNTLDRFWVAVRSEDRRGATGISNFITTWECEDGTLGTDAALAADATASPGGGGNTKITITPGTATWEERLSLKVSDVTANTSDQFGWFQRLLRMQVSADMWEVRLKIGYANWVDADFVEGPIVEIDNTNWDWYEMGVKPLPLRNLHALPTSVLADSYEDNYEVQIWARRTGVAGTLDLDCIAPLPVGEAYLRIENANVGSTEIVDVGVSAGGDWDAASAEGRRVQAEAYNWFLPPGNGNMYLVYAQSDQSVFTNQMTCDLSTYWKRYHSLRGSA